MNNFLSFTFMLHQIWKQLIILSLLNLFCLSNDLCILCGLGNFLFEFLNLPHLIFVIFKTYVFQIKSQFNFLLVKHYSNWDFVEIFILVCFNSKVLHCARRDRIFVTHSCRSSLFKSLIKIGILPSGELVFSVRPTEEPLSPSSYKPF